MKIENTIRENVEFLLNMYRRELKYYEEKEEQNKLADGEHIVIDMIENSIIELETILEYDNQNK